MASNIPEDIQKQLLLDPRVQAVIADQIKAAGQSAADALKDPKVQNAIIAQCKDKFPQYAEVAATKVAEWAHDPKVQEQVTEYAGAALQYGACAAKVGAATLVAKVQQGPAGVRFLAFVGGVASCVFAILTFINPLTIASGISTYIICIYQLIFGLTVMLFEANPDHLHNIPILNTYHELLCDKAKFLTENLGRGLFYFFQGTLWICLASWEHVLTLALGLYIIFVGAILIAVHFAGWNALTGSAEESLLKEQSA